jgi:hypothetical protein
LAQSIGVVGCSDKSRHELQLAVAITSKDCRTSFAPETISSKRNEHDRTQTKAQQKSTALVDVPSLIAVWLQVRVPPGPPRFALTGYAWRSHAEHIRVKRVRRSSNEVRAKTDSCTEAFGNDRPVGELRQIALGTSRRTNRFAPYRVLLSAACRLYNSSAEG